MIAEMQARLEERLDKIETSLVQTNTRVAALEQKATRHKHEDLSTDSESEDQMDTDERRRRRRRRRSQNSESTIGENAQEGSRTQGHQDSSLKETVDTEATRAMRAIMENVLARLDPITQQLDALQCRFDGLAAQSSLHGR